MRTFSLQSFAAFLALALAGCGDRHPSAPATGAYGPLTTEPSKSIARVRPDSSAAQPWTNAGLSVIQTELSPATLYHSTSKTLSFFANMMETGIGGPTFASIETEQGPKIFKPGEEIAPSRLRESWFVVWWSGATNWTNWDSPWFLTLQHKPSKIRFDTNGLHFTFANEAGYAALMPMYGYYKPLPLALEKHPFYSLKEKKKRVLTWEWFKALPADPLARARYWASALREFPIYCEDSFSVDRAHDSVTFRQSFLWLSWNDDWNTKHLKLAPVSPALAHAWREGFPAEFSKQPFDMEIFTPYGPYYGVEGADSYDVTLPVLRYVNETEVIETKLTNSHPTVAAALEKLRQTARANFPTPDLANAGANSSWLAKALPFMDDMTHSNTVLSLRKLFREDVMTTSPSSQHKASLESIWAYAHFTGDWDLIRERWPLIKTLFTPPAQTRWGGFGCDEIATLGDEAAPCLAMARLAWKVGDIDEYNFACQMFARELVHQWLQVRGTKYFRDNQPWHSMEAMDGEVYLTRLRRDGSGWQLDGPNYPQLAGERHFTNRWLRFNNADVGRFFSDYLKPEVKAELEKLQRWHNNQSLMQLRSLLLNEGPAELAHEATPDQFTGPPSDVMASCLAVLRASHPTRFERLIPGGAPSPFVAGVERAVPGANPHLVQHIVTERRDQSASSATPIWPRLTWGDWKTPTGSDWNFGQVTDSTNVPSRSDSTSLNWNTRVVITHAP